RLVSVSSDILVDGAGVQTVAAADAVKPLALILAGQQITAAVVHQYHVHFFGTVHFVGLPGAAEYRIIHRNVLSGAVGGQQGPENIQVGQVGNDLFDADDGDMQFRERRTQPAVAFVLGDADAARIGDHEIR